METTRAVISGIGPVSAIGCGKGEFWNALINGQHGFGPITLCDVSRSPSKIGAEVKNFHLDQFVERGRAISRRSPRAVQLALAAAVLAMHDAGLGFDDFDPDRFGIYLGTSVANLLEGFPSRDQWIGGGVIAPHMAFYLFTHSAACMLSAFFNLRGPMHTLSQGCNSGLDALGQALRLIQTGVADRMLVVGTDCELEPYVMALLNASGSLSTRYNEDPGSASRPFDKNRDGNVIGEGAAAIILESETQARERGARIYARFAGYSICAAGENRKYSHDAPELDLRPCVRAFQTTMTEANWHPDKVDLVSANGSSSILYDKVEAAALAEVFGDQLPNVRVHSTKSMLGQHGAGSSALQVAAACLSIANQIAPPTINYTDPDPACGSLRVATSAESCDVKRVLVHSIGLGGFYYSCGAFAATDDNKNGAARSDKPFVPWKAYRET